MASETAAVGVEELERRLEAASGRDWGKCEKVARDAIAALRAVSAGQAGGLTAEQVIAALRNIGHPVECGACMEVFYTGTTMAEHTCAAGQAGGLQPWACGFCGSNKGKETVEQCLHCGGQTSHCCASPAPAPAPAAPPPQANYCACLFDGWKMLTEPCDAHRQWRDDAVAAALASRPVVGGPDFMGQGGRTAEAPATQCPGLSGDAKEGSA